MFLDGKSGEENDDDAHDRAPSTATKQYRFTLAVHRCSRPVANTCDIKRPQMTVITSTCRRQPSRKAQRKCRKANAPIRGTQRQVGRRDRSRIVACLLAAARSVHGEDVFAPRQHRPHRIPPLSLTGGIRQRENSARLSEGHSMNDRKDRALTACSVSPQSTRIEERRRL